MQLLNEIVEGMRQLFYGGPYKLVCDPSVYAAIQRIGDYQPHYQPHPMDRFFGADVIVAPELGYGVWELYSKDKLVDYGKSE